jgi:putative transposase
VDLNKKLSISRQFTLLHLPRTSYCRSRQALLEGIDNLELMRLIDEENMRHPFYRSRRGNAVKRKRLHRLVRLIGLESVSTKTKHQQAEKGTYGLSLSAEKDVDHRS